MQTYYLELDGSPSLFETYPALEIIWHKTAKETYCHSARLVFRSSGNENLAKITLLLRHIIAPNKKESETLEIPLTRFLPSIGKDGLVCLPLNDTELVKGIELCEFTKSKGRQHELVHYATGLKLDYAGVEQLFPFIDQLPPKLICGDILSHLEKGQKIDIHINLIK